MRKSTERQPAFLTVFTRTARNMDKYFAAGPLVKLKTVVAFNIDYFGNEKGEVTSKDSSLLEVRGLRMKD
jgi:hypothetical protein